ncbi:hypothetical protein JYB87_07820 [Shewanella avicenniae]|uniref:Uncharacterized protein n=1 Tax=Shewanella avicenniae TaxID=2814294 RepID=A0ABX7QUI7_9GAMM|nr:hypothetical protein [Shewanella avicenniae]QSX35109.1 hypothetical protein JYB87_07820 [Shewanella avicenniae]
MIIGNPTAVCCVYLPHSPIIPPDWHWQQTAAMQQLLESNSNHWRKIFVISAKIFTPNLADWRGFLQQQLLQIVCFYADETILNQHASIELFSGKEIVNRLFARSPQIMDNGEKIVNLSNGQWQLPYFDYRQFPNALITEFRQCLAQ